MTETPDHTTPEKQEIQPEPAPKPAWYDSLIKVFQELLEFNMHTYKTEKAPRL